MVQILVVEDSAVDRMLIGGLLGKQTQWAVEFVNDGQEAVDRIGTRSTDDQSANEPDVIITDLQMPNMDGLQLVRRLRKTHADIPVVLVTSHGSEAIALETLRSGATSYTPKSMMQADLVNTVKQVLEMAKRMRYTHDTQAMPAPKQVAFVLENEASLIGATMNICKRTCPVGRIVIGCKLEWRWTRLSSMRCITVIWKSIQCFVCQRMKRVTTN